MSLNIRKVNYENFQQMLEKKLLLVAGRDDMPELVDDTFKLLKEEKAHLFIGNGGGFILQPIVDDGIPSVNVFFAWGQTGRGTADCTSVVEMLARNIGATRLIAYSHRKGVYRLCRRHGFSKVGYNGQGRIKFVKDF